MPIRQRPATGDDLTRAVITNRLELPYPANLFEITHVQASVGQHAINAWAMWLESELRCHRSFLHGCRGITITA